MIFARKINKIPEFYTICPKNSRILHNSCPRIFFQIFFGGGTCPPAPISYAYVTVHIFSPLARKVTVKRWQKMQWPLMRLEKEPKSRPHFPIIIIIITITISSIFVKLLIYLKE